MSKSILYSHWSNSANETMLKIGHLAKSIAFAWAIAFAQILNLGQRNLNCLNRPCCKVYTAYSLCKIFGQHWNISK